VRVSVPEGAGSLPVCQDLHQALPDVLDDREARPTRPSSPGTAAWGDPPVRLRCGVPRPQGLLPTSEVIVVEGVDWFRTPGAEYVFTTSGRRVQVEVRVPRSVPGEQATAPLVDLAGAVSSTVPHG
jgi:hypothetical protein